MMQDLVSPGCDPQNSRNPIGNFVGQFDDFASRAQEKVPDERQQPEAEMERLRNRLSVMDRQYQKDDNLGLQSLKISAEELDADPETLRYMEDFQRSMAGERPSFLDDPSRPSLLGDAFLPQYEQHLREQLDYAAAPFSSPQFRGLLEQFPYSFVPDNPFLASPTPFDDALKLYQNGELRDAILAFEAEVQHNGRSSAAWRWLGTAHAENDEDKLAIASLLRAVEADPENLAALLDLGVSFTNELAQTHALKYLKLWIEKHPQYRPIAAKMQFSESDYSHFGFHSMHVKMFHFAEEMNNADPDVYTVLGVLYNLSREFDKAEECFKRALDLDPDNYSLWNKLGATQANSTKNNGSLEAVYAYRHALELKPNYVRAWVNMGISYANQNKHRTSARYYLKALSQNDRAEHIWTYLRIALASMEREDLVRRADARDPSLLHETF